MVPSGALGDHVGPGGASSRPAQDPGVGAVRHGRGPRVVARAATNDARTALESLDAVGDLEVSAVLPGHGEPWFRGTAAAVAAAPRKRRAAAGAIASVGGHL